MPNISHEKLTTKGVGMNNRIIAGSLVAASLSMSSLVYAGFDEGFALYKKEDYAGAIRGSGGRGIRGTHISS